jgi:hypothetical protein
VIDSVQPPSAISIGDFGTASAISSISLMPTCGAYLSPLGRRNYHDIDFIMPSRPDRRKKK